MQWKRSKPSDLASYVKITRFDTAVQTFDFKKKIGKNKFDLVKFLSIAIFLKIKNLVVSKLGISTTLVPLRISLKIIIIEYLSEFVGFFDVVFFK